mmetsp:Transcript_53681/g.78648  ORF Transcript_53681/g.78648 Transcript_53681/m.78648 type:complete len:86 (+) Transcript_53681:175-432(+)
MARGNFGAAPLANNVCWCVCTRVAHARTARVAHVCRHVHSLYFLNINLRQGRYGPKVREREEATKAPNGAIFTPTRGQLQNDDLH